MTNGIFEIVEEYPYLNYLRGIYRNPKIDNKSRKKIKLTLCRILKIKYEASLSVEPIYPHVDIPGGSPREPEKYDMAIVDKEYGKEPTYSKISFRVNKEKIMILNQALALECFWAKKELKKLKVLKTHIHEEIL